MAIQGVHHSSFVRSVTGLLAPGKSPTLVAKRLASSGGGAFLAKSLRRAGPMRLELRQLWDRHQCGRDWSGSWPQWQRTLRHPTSYQRVARFHGQILQDRALDRDTAVALRDLFFGHVNDLDAVLPQYAAAIGAEMLSQIHSHETWVLEWRERAFCNAASSLDQTLFAALNYAEALRWSEANADVLPEVAAIERAAGGLSAYGLLDVPPLLRTLHARGIDAVAVYQRFLEAYPDTRHAFTVLQGLVEALQNSPALPVALDIATDIAWESTLPGCGYYFDLLIDAINRWGCAGGELAELQAIAAQPNYAYEKIRALRALHREQPLPTHSAATGRFIDWAMATWDHIHFGVPLPVVGS